MRPLRVGEVVRASGGRLVRGDLDAVVMRVSTDSRTGQEGDLFVALAGERFDGHRFAGDAVKRGARAVMASRDRVHLLPDGPYAVVEVDDTVAALGRLAGWYRAGLGARVVAVTGSVGKTTTKEMTAAILSEVGSTDKAPASFNNEIGVPLAILSAGDQTRFLVLEIAMRGPGQIRAMGTLARPDVGIVTNVGESHVGMLGSMEAIAEAKAELLGTLREGGVAVLNADDPRVRAMARRVPDGAGVWTFGRDPAASVRVEDVHGGGLGGTVFRLVAGGVRMDCHLALPGRHLVLDAAAAAAAAMVCGAPPEAVVRGLGGYGGAKMRMEVVALEGSRVVVLNDAYNASPASMRAALETLERTVIERGGRAVAVVGEMLELGDRSQVAHQEIGEEAARHGVQVLIAVGGAAEAIAQGARAAGGPAVVVERAADAGEAATLACRTVRPGDTVLVKGSRAIGLEAVVRALVARLQDGGESR